MVLELGLVLPKKIALLDHIMGSLGDLPVVYFGSCESLGRVFLSVFNYVYKRYIAHGLHLTLESFLRGAVLNASCKQG